MLKLRLLRRSLGFSIHELSARTGITAPQISLLERGLAAPSPHEMRRLAAVLASDTDRIRHALFEKVDTHKLIELLFGSENGGKDYPMVLSKNDA